jgi:hypothetical protein
MDQEMYQRNSRDGKLRIFLLTYIFILVYAISSWGACSSVVVKALRY